MLKPIEITSGQNARVKQAAKLRERRGRRQQGRTIVDGVREVAQALRSNWSVDELFLRKSFHNTADAASLLDGLEGTVQLLIVNDDVFEKLSFGDRNEGAIATVKIPNLELSTLTVPPSALICVLDEVEKPGNVGAVLRTLDAAGGDALILSNPHTDIANPNTIRASLGAIFSIPIAAGPAEDVVAWLQQHNVKTLAARVEDGASYSDSLYQDSVAIVLGSEAHGLGDHWSGPSIQNVAIPMRGRVDSLNVSAAAAVLIFEAARQRASK